MTGVLVHEWIAQDGGSENVLQALSNLYPRADVVCAWNDSTGRFDPDRIRETWLARTALRRHKAVALLAMPIVWRHLTYREYDWALISSHAFAHQATFPGAPSNFRRMVYVHTPARYIWARDFDARGDTKAARAASLILKPLDRKRANEGAEFAANSSFVRDRIRRAWNIDSRIIHPPVNVEGVQAVRDWREKLSAREVAIIDRLPPDFVLGASRFIPYKRLEDVIKVGEATERPVVLAGHGPHHSVLREAATTARVPVHFVNAPSNALLYALYQLTALYVFPAIEDFGIMPIEAMAAGAPVLGQITGGVGETVLPGTTGELVQFPNSPSTLRAAAERAIDTSKSHRRKHAQQFSTSRFNEQISSWVGGQ